MKISGTGGYTAVWHRLILGGLIMLLFTGCSTRYYGVPEEDWLGMSEQQRQSAIEGYNERERIRAEQQAEEARLRFERESAAILQQQQREDAIYRGEGHLGDLIRVSVLGGRAKFDFRSRPFEPFSLKLADGAQRQVKLRSSGHKYLSWSTTLDVRYRNGLLELGGIKIPYDSEWIGGKQYQGLQGGGSSRLSGVNLQVMVVPQRSAPAVLIYQR